MKTKLLLIGFICLSMQTIKAQDFSKAASEYCNCLGSLEDSISKDYIPYIIDASNAPQFSLAYFQAISPKGKDFAAIGMKSWSHIKNLISDERTEIGKCVAVLNKTYYEYQRDQSARKSFYLSILTELESTGQCGLYAAILKSLFRQVE